MRAAHIELCRLEPSHREGFAPDLISNFKWDITKDIDWTPQAVSSPATADGTRPESNDYRMLFGRGFEF